MNRIGPSKVAWRGGESIEVVAFSRDAGALFIGESGGVIRLVDLETGEIRSTLQVPPRWTEGYRYIRQMDERSVIFGKPFATPIQVWDLATGEVLREIAGSGPFSSSADDRTIAHRVDWRNIEILTFPDSRLICRIAAAEGIEDLCLTGDGRLLLSASVVFPFIGFEYDFTENPDRNVSVWDARTGGRIATLEGHAGDICCLAVDPAGRRALSAAKDGTVIFWDLEEHEVLREHRMLCHWAQAAEFSPSGRLVLLGGHGGGIHCLDGETGALLDTLRDHPKCVKTIAFSRDGGMAASAGHDREVRLWRIRD